MNAAVRVGGSHVVAGRGDLIRGGRGREGRALLTARPPGARREARSA
jgi:hypothetical protein